MNPIPLATAGIGLKQLQRQFLMGSGTAFVRNLCEEVSWFGIDDKIIDCLRFASREWTAHDTVIADRRREEDRTRKPIVRLRTLRGRTADGGSAQLDSKLSGFRALYSEADDLAAFSINRETAGGLFDWVGAVDPIPFALFSALVEKR